MAIKFKHRGDSYTADTPEEAAKLVALLKQQDAEDAKRRAWNRATIEQGGPGAVAAFIEEEYGTWTPDVFLRFMARLGPSQKAALVLLVSRRSVTDEELREALKARGNQALAGILSGISKQAAALNIPARSIFGFENLRTAGKRRSTYTVADSFLQISREMNWPLGSQE
jgi:hypothetical protein